MFGVNDESVTSFHPREPLLSSGGELWVRGGTIQGDESRVRGGGDGRRRGREKEGVKVDIMDERGRREKEARETGADDEDGGGEGDEGESTVVIEGVM